VDLSSFEWDFTGRRDPFEFRPPAEARPRPGTGVVGPGVMPVGPRPQETPGEGEGEGLQVRQFAEAKAAEAQGYLVRRDFEKVRDAAGEALSKIDSIKLPAPELVERLERLRRTALRLERRTQVEEEFARLTISIEGVVWRPDRAYALINGEMLEPGDAVKEAKGVRVEDIRPGEVVFSLKGVRIRKSTLR
jgi:hypothetical protein